ncbi:NAD(+) diphosphatase [Rhodoblastus acidophilus]|uniref:NAD(+) diphosphatase n=1 Tax=Candidatus Rhodoblastus alkanivorans TaxID=2954117 RepID=A0ABS9Z2H9_9HYPH|nr:NAD(+) diphosphatase [Candidatus Rhodoblastus alkanivorans]MCI4677521.1 NAD(+) diphosphatase [Candidatus Rhodoblastus alkanivorans]MCI4681880.1 NAD(+) diphosphatase [Candidatus Rhodoblastus alkanivorans]MDI4642930.1 NAD(+) diphosphatase [Rhodoblastus acidophilus]
MSACDLAIGFAGNTLDRLSELREDAARLAKLALAPQARAVVFVQSMPVLRAEGETLAALHPLPKARALGSILAEVLLGRDATGPIFALLLPDEAAQAEAPLDAAAFIDQRRLVLPGRPELQIHDLRSLANKQALPREEIAVLAQAKSILHYHAHHRFCPRCGALTLSVHGGWRRDCPACDSRHFPRTDPVAIMMVTDGDFCLLGRQMHFPEKMYSCLAGFVEGGETFEEAVRREVKEEAGILVGAVRYVASQPWPFPASIMIGCEARALSREIVMDREELEDCRWFSRAEARAMIEGRHDQGLFAPNPIAIAHTLLAHWLRKD